MLTIILLIVAVGLLLGALTYQHHSNVKLRAQLQSATDEQETAFLKGFDAGYESGYEHGIRHKNLEWIAKQNPRPSK
jgi:hypothetical protein